MYKKTPWNKGKHFSEEIRRKMSEKKKGCIPWNKGLTMKTDKRVEQYVKKGAQIKKGKHYSPNWFEPYSVDWTETLKKAIRERDHYTCQLCKMYGYVIKNNL